MNNSSRRGFTIVELLMVIVVISILATITTVAYTGIQERARNTLRLQAARNAVQAANILTSTFGLSEIRATMQETDSWWRACVGTGYQDMDSDGLGDCGVYEGTPMMSESPAFNALLSQNTDISNSSNFPVVSTDNFDLYGPFMESAWINSRDAWVVEYSLEGEEQSCGLQPLVYYTEDDEPTLTPSATPKWTRTGVGTTECAVFIQ